MLISFTRRCGERRSRHFQGNQLIIEGERRRPEEFGKDAWTQLSYGTFYSAVTLPNGLDGEKIQCKLQDGVLDIRVPVAEAMKPRQIQIETGETSESLSS